MAFRYGRCELFLCRFDIGVDHRRNAEPWCHRIQSLESFRQRQVDQITAVEMQAVEEERLQQSRIRLVCGRSEPAHGLLERSRPAVVAEHQRFTVENDCLTGQPEHNLDKVGHPIGHIPQRAGEHPHVTAVTVHLNSCTVEFEVDNDVGAEVGKRARQVVGGSRKHRCDRASDL
ncbi:Uncharacterised protein [Mycobacteroides abscessus subsp. abscessus]|nr:Uncharacterised protein [Mycobacteroides abscessus subsp. abscessus]